MTVHSKETLTAVLLLIPPHPILYGTPIFPSILYRLSLVLQYNFLL